MKEQIDARLDLLTQLLSLFNVSNIDGVLEKDFIPCSGTDDRNMVVVLSQDFDSHLRVVTDQYLSHSDFSGDEGQLGFLFDTIAARRDPEFPKNFWVIPITEIESTPDKERLLFTRSELSRAVDYLRNFFNGFYDPETPPWKVDSPDVCWNCEHLRLNSCPFGHNPNIVSGNCIQWATNPATGYGPYPVETDVDPWDVPGAVLDPIPFL